jgi:hypothetical protein
VRRKYKFTKTYLYLSLNQRKRNAIKLPLSCRNVKVRSRILGSNTKDLFRKISLQQEKLMRQVSTLKSTM